jgi:hypothetical protein
MQLKTRVPEPVHQHGDEPLPRPMLTEEALQSMQVDEDLNNGDSSTSQHASETTPPALSDWLRKGGKDIERPAPSDK